MIAHKLETIIAVIMLDMAGLAYPTLEDIFKNAIIATTGNAMIARKPETIIARIMRGVAGLA